MPFWQVCGVFRSVSLPALDPFSCTVPIAVTTRLQVETPCIVGKSCAAVDYTLTGWDPLHGPQFPCCCLTTYLQVETPCTVPKSRAAVWLHTYRLRPPAWSPIPVLLSTTHLQVESLTGRTAWSQIPCCCQLHTYRLRPPARSQILYILFNYILTSWEPHKGPAKCVPNSHIHSYQPIRFRPHQVLNELHDLVQGLVN